LLVVDKNGRGLANGQRPEEWSRARGGVHVQRCAELQHHVFNYGVVNAADLMKTTQEMIAQYIGLKYGEDISNEVMNKTTVVVTPPTYSAAILLRHQEWETYVRKKQTNVKAALEAKLKQLEAETVKDIVEIADVENKIEDITYLQGKDVPYNLTNAESLKFSNESKSHSHRVATLEKHSGNEYALIYGQCTQILQDKMKQDHLLNLGICSWE
jgi:hypothetical protein